MPEAPELLALRTALARASRRAHRHPDDPLALAARDTARMAYAVESSLQTLTDKLGSLSISGDAARRLQEGLARVLGDAA